MDVIGRYLNFGDPCDVCLQGTFLNVKVVVKMTQSINILGLIPLYIKCNSAKQVWFQVYVV